MLEVEEGQSSGPEGVDDLCFHTGEFSPSPPHPPLPPASGPYLSLETHIPASRPKSLEAGIWASRLGFEGGGTEEKKKKEKIPLCESIGHPPLRGRCPKV